jgi:hypothetical protein
MIITQENGAAVVGNVFVKTVDNRGLTPEELAETALDKILYVGDQSHPAIREQALVFKEHVREILVVYMKEAVKNDRATIANKLKNAGHSELISLLGE